MEWASEPAQGEQRGGKRHPVHSFHLPSLSSSHYPLAQVLEFPAPFRKVIRTHSKSRNYSSRKQMRNPTALCWAAYLNMLTEGAISVLHCSISWDIQSQRTGGVRWQEQRHSLKEKARPVPLADKKLFCPLCCQANYSLVSACCATLGHHWRMGKVNWRVNLTLHPLFFRASNYMEP